ncbi:Transcriptional regulator, AraC family [Actinacidiphila bryophytorum]|uniref:Transcriptional regulator, AraC family n=1 Tax=Actinacidiphila bryophytorum TaxID=1436133 RepID=A0A9W4GXG8_9ACTN|nr:Transcriptional regulator, AraC family [Actinacidiphila bryophytorum]
MRGLRPGPHRRRAARVRLRRRLRGRAAAAHPRGLRRLRRRGSRTARPGRPGGRTRRRRRHVAGIPAGRARRAQPGRGARRDRPERLLGGLRARRGGPARRAALRGALATHRAARRPAPRGPRRAGRALRGRRRGRHLGRHRRGHRRVPAPGAQGAGGRRRQRHRPPHGRAPAPGGRPGAVRGPAAAPGHQRLRRRGALLDGAPPRPGRHRGRPGRPRPDVPAHLRQALPAGDRHDAVPLAPGPAHLAGPRTPRRHGPHRRRGRCPRGFWQRRDPAASLLPPGRHHPPRLPPHLPPRRRPSLGLLFRRGRCCRRGQPPGARGCV